MDREDGIQRLVVIRPATADFISLREELCNGCAKCALVCPALLWKMRRGKVALAPDYRRRCLECAGCYQICEAHAILFRFPPAGEGVVVSQG